MDGFSYRNGRLCCEDIAVNKLAERYGTPLYVYSRSALVARVKELKEAFRSTRPLICYSVKANGNLSILRLLARQGAGFDIVSGGELFRALKANAKPNKIVFAGVGKTADEIHAAINAKIRIFNVESVSELRTIDRVASRLGAVASVALRLNPNVAARSHAKTTTARKENKFGIDLHRARKIFAERSSYPNIALCGIHLHLGSPIYSVAPFREALRKATQFVREVRALGANVSTLNIGGGYCIPYEGQDVITPRDYAAAIAPVAKRLGVELILEPGRFIAGNSGILVAQVTYVKQGWLDRRFVVLDTAMNDLLRPALYDAYHHIWPVAGSVAPILRQRRRRTGSRNTRLEKVDIVGPICETSDCFARDRKLPPVREGEFLAIYGAGAYGMSMSSNYNSRPRPCEIMVSGKRHRLIRQRETYRDLIRGE